VTLLLLLDTIKYYFQLILNSGCKGHNIYSSLDFTLENGWDK